MSHISPRVPRLVLLPLAASLLLAIGVFLLARENQKLEQEMTELKEQLVHARRDRAQAEGILEALRSPEALRITLSPQKAPSSQPRVDAVYAPRDGRLVVLAANLAQIPDDKVYQLWLMSKDAAPIPAGTFRPDKFGHAVYTLTLLQDAAPTGFSATLEPAKGSATPTMPFVLVGNR